MASARKLNNQPMCLETYYRKSFEYVGKIVDVYLGFGVNGHSQNLTNLGEAWVV